MIIFYFIYFIYFISVACTLVINRNTKLIQIYFLIIFLISHFILIGFRDYSSGTDTITYLYSYDLLRHGVNFLDFEIFFTWLLELFVFLSLDGREFILAISFFYSLFLIFIYRRFSGSTGLVVVFGLVSGATFFDLETNGLRQGLAIFLAILGMLYFRGLYVILILVAAGLFHYSTFIILAFYLFGEISFLREKLALQRISFFVLILLIAAVFGFNFIGLSSFSFLVSDVQILEKFITYTDSNSPASYESQSFFGRLPFFFSCTAVIFCFIWKSKSLTPDFFRIYFIFLLSIIFYYFVASMGYSYRWTYFPLIISPVLIGIFLEGLKSNVVRVRLSILILVIYFSWSTYDVWTKIFNWKTNVLF